MLVSFEPYGTAVPPCLSPTHSTTSDAGRRSGSATWADVVGDIHVPRLRCDQSPHGAPRSANAMSISPERVEHLAEGARHITPGRHAGRVVDGVEIVIDGASVGRMPPRWIEQLESRGYDPAVDGPVMFEVMIDQRRGPSLPDVREALYEALATIGAGRHPDRIRIEARTVTGRSVEVVSGYFVIGMAIGALEDPPITVIDGPVELPRYLPGERPKKKARSRRGGSSRG